jgi:hypothetical protein
MKAEQGPLWGCDPEGGLDADKMILASRDDGCGGVAA